MNLLYNIAQLATCREDGAQGDLHAIRGRRASVGSGDICWGALVWSCPESIARSSPWTRVGGWSFPG